MTQPVAQTLKAIVCGTGFGRFYLRALAQHPRIQLAGILSTGSEASQRCAREMNIAHYSAVADVPDDIDVACVVVRAGVSGGCGADVARALLCRGIHVLQEHPLHPEELAACLRVAHQHQVRYDVNGFYPHVVPIAAFLRAAALLRQQQPVCYLDGMCGVQVLYPWLDIVGRALGRLRPLRLALMTPAQVGPYTCLSGTVGDVPVTLRVQNQIHPGDADNHALLLHRVTLTAQSGVLALADTHGPALWSPRLHTHRDATQRLVLDGPGTERLGAASSTPLAGSEPGSFRTVFDRLWPQAIQRALDAFLASIGDAALAQRQSQWTLALTAEWHRLSTLLGPPHLFTPPEPPALPLLERYREVSV